MAYFYSKTTSGFYHSSVHAEMPEDAVAITDEQHATLMEAQASGKIIVADGKGKPKAVNPPEPTAEQLLAQRAANRAAAYRDEADPLFFKAQRGEVTQAEWLAKVDEIKARYP
jgi:hypothetical protein